MFSKKKIFISIILLFVISGGLFAYKAGRTITVIGKGDDSIWTQTISDFTDIPEPEENRIDILIVGIRGVDKNSPDSELKNGEFLADTIMLASLNTDNDKAALVSIPRDLYVEIPDHGKEKINSAYAVGEARHPGGGGLQLMKALTSVVSGVYVDYAVSLDFEGFEKIIDDIGGITIYRDTEFSEPKQWTQDGREGERYWRLEETGWTFYLPAGSNQMNSKEALYYVRSRYSSSDFDRMRRQHQVIEAIRSKSLNLGILANPIKLFNILDVLGDNIRSDIEISQIKDFISLIKERKIQNFERAFLEENGEKGLLISDNVDGKYVLIPKSGNYNEIRSMFKGIIE